MSWNKSSLHGHVFQKYKTTVINIHVFAVLSLYPFTTLCLFKLAKLDL